MSSSSAHSPAFSALGRRSTPPTIARLMAMALETPGLLSLAAGFTDNATLPVGAVQDAAKDLASRSGEPEHLQYGTNRGRPLLRRQLAARLAAAEPGLGEDELEKALFATNGSQQALYLAVQVLCDPGDIVLVDRPSYFVFLEMLTGLGIQARSIPTDATGRVDCVGLERILADLRARGQADRLKAVYFVSYFSNPSARSLDESEKNDIAVALTAQGFVIPVIEDAAYRELYFRAPHPAPSVLALDAWRSFPKLYSSTLTKPFATGLKVGYGVCSDEHWLAKMLHVKGHHDFGTANFNQALFERVFAAGGFDAQLKKIRPAYEGKMRALHEALRDGGLPELGWTWAEPAGGLYLWLKAPDRIATGLDSEFCQACIRAGVLYVPGELCFGDLAPSHFARLSFGVLPQDSLREAAKRFISVAKRFV